MPYIPLTTQYFIRFVKKSKIKNFFFQFSGPVHEPSTAGGERSSASSFWALAASLVIAAALSNLR